MTERREYYETIEDHLLDPAAINDAEIRHQLGRIITSATFRQSDRLRAFLKFSVTETLAGRNTSISAPTVAVEVFGEGRELDQKSESLVRVQARQLRLKLVQYYDTEGVDDPIRIEIPAGGYVSTFRRMGLEKLSSGKLYNTIPARRIALHVRGIEYLGEKKTTLGLLTGLQDQIVSALAGFDHLAVSSTILSDVRGQNLHAHPAALLFDGFVIDRGTDSKLSVSLSSASSHQMVWSKEYTIGVEGSNSGDQLKEIPRHVAVNIAGPMGPAVRFALEQFDYEPGIADPAFHLLLRGFRYITTCNVKEHAVLRDELEAVVAGTQSGAAQKSMLARLYSNSASWRFNQRDDQDKSHDRALELAQAAVAQNPMSSFSWWILAHIRYETRQMERAKAAALQAIELNPNDTDAIAFLAFCQWELGDFENGIQNAEESISLNDWPPSWYKFVLVHDHIRCGRYEAAKDLLAEIEIGSFFWVSFLEAVVCGHLSRHKEFQRAYEILQAEFPWLLTALYEDSSSMQFPDEFISRCLDGLRIGREANGLSGDLGH